MSKINTAFAGLLLSFFPLLLGAQSFHPKIDSALLARFASESEAEFLIILQAQADIGQSAAKIKNGLEKSRFIYKTLSELADNTQGNIRSILKERQAPQKSFWIINALWAKGDLNLIQTLAALPEVARIEDNPVMHLSRPPQDNTLTDSQNRSVSPWGITKINADDVWAMGYRGQGVVVGGQDTGYEWEHPAIKDHYRGWSGSSADHNYNWHDAISATINGGTNSCGLNLVTPCDDNAHGTHTAGTMVGVYGTDTIGVAPAAQWMGCRNMEEGDGTPATYIECFEWFAMPTDLNDANPNAAMKPNVINNSWGCPGSEGCNSSNYSTMNTVINNVRSANILVVVSAGNSGGLGCSSVNAPPAIFANAFAVGATNSSDNITGFSSRGPAIAFTTLTKPDVSAPGEAVYSCVGVNNNPSSYSTASWDGTSMAGPHVAGLAALVLSARPDLKTDIPMLEMLIKNNAVPRFASAPFCGGDNSGSRPNNVFGWGRVDALATVNAALALPVEWVSFRARAIGKHSELNWTTASESECNNYVVLRSADAISWEKIDVVACQNNLSGADYTYIDQKPLSGINYYRLEQADYNGAKWHSAVASVTFNAGGVDMRLQTQFSSDMIFVDIIRSDKQFGQFLFDVYSVDGKLLRSSPLEQSASVVLEGLASGLYVATLRTEAGAVLSTKKFVWK